MKETNAILSEYLIRRGLKEPKLAPTRDVVLASDELLGKVAVMDTTALRALIEARVDDNRDELIMEAMPEEVFVLRQVMVELSALLQDQEYYRAEHERRKKKREATPAIEVILPQEDSSANSESSV